MNIIRKTSKKIEKYILQDKIKIYNNQKIIYAYASKFKAVVFLHKHNLLLLLMDHLISLVKSICLDSNIAKDMQCRAKAIVITTQCLAKKCKKIE